MTMTMMMMMVMVHDSPAPHTTGTAPHLTRGQSPCSRTSPPPFTIEVHALEHFFPILRRRRRPRAALAVYCFEGSCTSKASRWHRPLPRRAQVAPQLEVLLELPVHGCGLDFKLDRRWRHVGILFRELCLGLATRTYTRMVPTLFQGGSFIPSAHSRIRAAFRRVGVVVLWTWHHLVLCRRLQSCASSPTFARHNSKGR